MESRLCACRNQAIAAMIEDLLRSNGIHPRPLDISAHISVAGASQWYDLWVPAEEEDRARDILTASGHGEFLASSKSADGRKGKLRAEG